MEMSIKAGMGVGRRVCRAGGGTMESLRGEQAPRTEQSLGEAQEEPRQEKRGTDHCPSGPRAYGWGVLASHLRPQGKRAWGSSLGMGHTLDFPPMRVSMPLHTLRLGGGQACPPRRDILGSLHPETH